MLNEAHSFKYAKEIRRNRRATSIILGKLQWLCEYLTCFFAFINLAITIHIIYFTNFHIELT